MAYFKLSARNPHQRRQARLWAADRLRRAGLQQCRKSPRFALCKKLKRQICPEAHGLLSAVGQQR